MHFFHRVYMVGAVAIFAMVPLVALAEDEAVTTQTYNVVTTKDYVDATTVPVYQGTIENGDTVTHQYDIMQVNSAGNLERVSPASVPTAGSAVPITAGAVYTALAAKEDTENKLNGASGSTVTDYATDTTKYPSAKAVFDYAVQKPATAAAGQVLTYGTGATADSAPVAEYIKIPVATGDPNASGATAPTAYASIWLQ